MRLTPTRRKKLPAAKATATTRMPAAPALVGEADGEQGVALAMRLGGERALPVKDGMVLLSPERLCRHVLVCGATGSGKTETVLRLAWTIAKSSDAPVFYLDGKGDRETAARFCGLMNDAGRTSGCSRTNRSTPGAGGRMSSRVG